MAFKIPLIVKLKMPDPEPRSGNCDVCRIWNGNKNIAVNQQQEPPVSPTIQNKVEEPELIFSSVSEKNNSGITLTNQVLEKQNNVINSNNWRAAVTSSEVVSTVPVEKEKETTQQVIEEPLITPINDEEPSLITVPIKNENTPSNSLDINDIINAPDEDNNIE